MPLLSPLFAVPTAVAMMEDAPALNAQLRELFLGWEAEGPVHANPDAYQVASTGLFESNFRLFDRQEAPIARLREFCWRQLYQLIGEVNGYDVATLRRLQIAHEAWFHVTRKRGSFGIHNHPMHAWSGVYCVTQEGDDPASDSGRFTVINPLATTNMYMDMSTFKPRLPYGAGPMSLRLQPGQLLLFPSWLLHYVTPFEPVADDAVRITVAFNTRFRLDGYQTGQR